MIKNKLRRIVWLLVLGCLACLPLQAADTKQPASLQDLPLILLPQETQCDTFAIVVSGDGGWASIDRTLAKHLFGKGVPIVGLNSLSYFWDAKTPEQISRDLDRIILHFLAAWNKKTVLVMGYSMGADVIPFMVSRLPASTMKFVRGVAMIAPSENANFEFHVSQWFGGSNVKAGLPILPEVKKIHGPMILCVGGENERDSLCQQLKAAKPLNVNYDVQMLEGGHHFSGEYKELGQLVGKKFGLE